MHRRSGSLRHTQRRYCSQPCPTIKCRLCEPQPPLTASEPPPPSLTHTGIMTLPDALAYFAILAAALARGNVVIAGWLLGIFCLATHLKSPANRRNFIQFWAGRMGLDGTLDRHAHNAGAPQHVTDQMVEEAYQGIISWRDAQRRNPYKSKEQMARDCPAVAKVLRESGVTVDTLITRIKAKHPNFQFVRLRVRFGLSDTHRADRLSKGTQLLQGFADLLHCMVFVDQKLINMWEEEVWGWVDTSVPNYAEGIKPAKYHGKVIKLKYYAAVHCKLGAFFIMFYTGTSGMDSHHGGNNYQVSSCHEQLRATPTLHVSNSTRQLLSPPGGLGATAADALIHPQPQHTPTLPQGFLSIQPVLGLSVSHATVSVVGLCQQSSAVALPVHFNQQPARHCQSNIPAFRLRPHTHTTMLSRLCWLVEAVCFHSIQLNQWLSITQFIKHPLPTAALATTHGAAHGFLIVVGCPHPQEHNMLCARLAAAVVVQLLLAVTGMVRMCCGVNCLVASADGCAVVLPTLPACLAHPSASLLLCTCRQRGRQDTPQRTQATSRQQSSTTSSVSLSVSCRPGSMRLA